MPAMRTLAGTLVLALLCGCASTPAPRPPAASAPEAATAATLAGPASEHAAELRARCGRAGAAGVLACYDRELLAVLRAEGVRPAMEALDALGALDAQVRRDGHMLAHSIGLAAYSGAAGVGRVFRQCLPSFQSGCYHGVIQSYFADLAGTAGGALTAEAVDSLCRDYRGDPSARWLLFQCVHGMGHGLVFFRGHHLPQALQGCDLLTDAWEREGCYGGAFMENVVQATAPHHAIGRPTGDGHAGEHAHHGASGGGGEPYRGLDPADPLYPCSTLEARYLNACYAMQTSAVLHFNRGDVAATARVCDSLGVAHRAICYQSLGRDISAYTVQNHREGVRLCSLGDPAYRAWCHIGFAKNLVDLTADESDGLAYCRALREPDSKRACYRAIAEELWVLTDRRDRWEAACARAEPDYRGECQAALGLARAPGAPLQPEGKR